MLHECELRDFKAPRARSQIDPLVRVTEFAEINTKLVHWDTSAMKRFLMSASLQHEPKASDVITLVKKTFFARVLYEILYHQV